MPGQLGRDWNLPKAFVSKSSRTRKLAENDDAPRRTLQASYLTYQPTPIMWLGLKLVQPDSTVGKVS
jgi:hypothetical protein